MTKAEEKKPSKTLSELKVEIKFHLGQMAGHAVEIGKLLIEAKEQVEYGEWYKWLESNFNLKKTMANNFMNVAERFGNLHSNGDLNLNQTQLIAMLALPKGEEEKFIAEKSAENNPVEDMTVKQLREEVAKWKADFEKQKSEVENLFGEIESYKDKITKAEVERDGAKAALKSTSEQAIKLCDENAKLQEELKNQYCKRNYEKMIIQQTTAPPAAQCRL